MNIQQEMTPWLNRIKNMVVSRCLINDDHNLMEFTKKTPCYLWLTHYFLSIKKKMCLWGEIKLLVRKVKLSFVQFDE